MRPDSGRRRQADQAAAPVDGAAISGSRGCTEEVSRAIRLALAREVAQVARALQADPRDVLCACGLDGLGGLGGSTPEDTRETAALAEIALGGRDLSGGSVARKNGGDGRRAVRAADGALSGRRPRRNGGAPQAR